MNFTISGSKKSSFTERLDFIKIVHRTVLADWHYYKKKSRNISFDRLRHMIDPNLEKPIFIIGAPRSGTTFLGECISALPEISYHFEPIATKMASRYIYEQQWEFNKAKHFYRSVYSWLMRVNFDGDLRFAEKTPRNCFLIDFLANAFPNSQFIHIIRDGRDVALSYSKKPWLQAKQAKSNRSEPGGYAYGPYARFWVESARAQEFESTSDIHRCIWAWRLFTENVLNFANSLPTSRYHELRYEKLVFETVPEAQRLLDFLNIDNSQSSDMFFEAVAKVKSDSVGQWQKELSTQDLHQINLEAGKLLQQLEYLSED